MGTHSASRVLNQYLALYAEDETYALADLNASLPAGPVWSDVVVIPACNENSKFLRSSPPAIGRSLMILVINQSPDASAIVDESNRSLFKMAQARFRRVWDSGTKAPNTRLWLLSDSTANREILLVDKFGPGRQLAPKGGVGLARKIGADLAAGLINSGRIGSKWIRCTDADVHLPVTYFSCTADSDSETETSALIYPFQHAAKGSETPGADVLLATQLYELSLHYYVAAMKSAASPYAFHTIGSTLAIEVDHYARVRGFPKREAGEDFYLLNKLAKTGVVQQMQAGPGCLPINIEPRLSDRVPFGTGAAVNKMTAMNDIVADYRFYNPRVFTLLGAWLASWPALWQSKISQPGPEAFSSPQVCNLIDGSLENHEIRRLLNALKEQNMARALEHAFRQAKNKHQFSRQMHTWFDAFRSLKLVHALREQLWPSISFVELCGRREYQSLLKTNPDLRHCHEHIYRL